jgi:hypothetical protein
VIVVYNRPVYTSPTLGVIGVAIVTLGCYVTMAEDDGNRGVTSGACRFDQGFFPLSVYSTSSMLEPYTLDWYELHSLLT